MTKAKRHHYVPQFYLEGFTRDGLLWVYDRKRNEFRRQPPKNTAVIGHYYAFTNTNGDLEYGLETDISKLESRGKTAIEKLDVSETLSPEERVDLSYFLALLFNRTPKFEREIDEISDSVVKLTMKDMFPTVDAVKSHFAATGEDWPYPPEEFFAFIHEEKYSVVGNRNITIKTMLEQLPEIARSLALMNWSIVHTKNDHAFVTGDSPFALLLTDEQRKSGMPVGVGSPHVTKAIPLTLTTTMLLGGVGLGFEHARASRDLVRLINNEVAAECEQFVFGPDERLVRSVVRRSKFDSGNSGSRLRVENVRHPTDPNREFMVVRRMSPDAPDEPIRVQVAPDVEPNTDSNEGS